MMYLHSLEVPSVALAGVFPWLPPSVGNMTRYHIRDEMSTLSCTYQDLVSVGQSIFISFIVFSYTFFTQFCLKQAKFLLSNSVLYIRPLTKFPLCAIVPRSVVTTGDIEREPSNKNRQRPPEKGRTRGRACPLPRPFPQSTAGMQKFSRLYGNRLYRPNTGRRNCLFSGGHRKTPVHDPASQPLRSAVMNRCRADARVHSQPRSKERGCTRVPRRTTRDGTAKDRPSSPIPARWPETLRSLPSDQGPQK